MLRVLPVLLAVTLVVYACVECVQTDPRAVRNLPRAGWVAVILLLPVLGAAAWLLAGRPAREEKRGRSRHGPIGPDDDPDFLREIRPSD